MHAATIEEHQRLQHEASEIVTAWAGTDPMTSEAQVRDALSMLAEDVDMPDGVDVDALLPFVVDACLAAGLLVGGEEVQRIGLQAARDSAAERQHQ